VLCCVMCCAMCCAMCCVMCCCDVYVVLCCIVTEYTGLTSENNLELEQHAILLEFIKQFGMVKSISETIMSLCNEGHFLYNETTFDKLTVTHTVILLTI
jgi:hypothetical protein